MINKKILVSLMVIGLAGAAATSGTLAYFSDTEASTGNTFTAGSIDMVFGESVEVDDGDGYAIDPLEGEPAFAISDMKPGDTHEATFGFKVTNNPSYVCAAITNVQDNENGVNDPESEVEPDNSVGELSDHLTMTAWVDDGDNEFDPNSDTDRVIGGLDGVPVPSPDDPTTVYELVDSDYSVFSDLANKDALNSGQKRFIAVNVTLPGDTGNEVQTDGYVADLYLYATQARNRGDFQCENLVYDGGFSYDEPGDNTAN